MESGQLSLSDGFNSLPPSGDHFRKAIMPVVIWIANKLVQIGTGFAISSNGIILTATHVIREAQRRLGHDDCEVFVLHETREINPESPETFVGGLIQIVQFSSIDATDIAVCCLSMPVRVTTNEKLSMPCVRLRLDPPQRGDRVISVGYHDTESSEKTTDGIHGGHKIQYSQQTVASSGQVTEVYPLRRDRGFLKWPCFETDAESRLGFSGGPIFHESGAVCGVVCSWTPSPKLDGAYTYYGAMLWPVFASSIRLLNEHGLEETYQLIDLTKSGLVSLVKGRCELFIETEANGLPSIQLRSPKGYFDGK